MAKEAAADANSDGVQTESKISQLHVLEVERELAAKDNELQQFLTDLHAAQAQLAALRQTAADREAALGSQMATMVQQRADVDAVLVRQSDYDEIKEELRVLKSIEFGDAQTAHTLEGLLLGKNRHLVSENTHIKSQLEDLTLRLKNISEAQAKAVTVVQSQESLIQRLEGDLSAVIAAPVAAGAYGAGPGSSMTRSVASLATSVSPLASVLAPDDGYSAKFATTLDGSDSILPIVAAQRDRFRARNTELEADVRHQAHQTATLRNELDGLRADNVKLFEKIKFLQGYQQTTSPGASAVDAAVARYSVEYEEQINPFKSFNTQERQRKYNGLNPADKFSLNLGRLVLVSHYARLFLFVYTLALHALVFVVLYKLSHAAGCQRDMAEVCMLQYAHHMHEVHHQDAAPGAAGAAIGLSRDAEQQQGFG